MADSVARARNAENFRTRDFPNWSFDISAFRGITRTKDESCDRTYTYVGSHSRRAKRLPLGVRTIDVASRSRVRHRRLADNAVSRYIPIRIEESFIFRRKIFRNLFPARCINNPDIYIKRLRGANLACSRCRKNTTNFENRDNDVEYIYICVSESHFSFRWKRGRGHADKKQGIDTIACITARKVRATIRRRLAALSFGTATKRANNTGFKNRLHPCKTVSDYAPVLRPPLPPPLSLSLRDFPLAPTPRYCWFCSLHPRAALHPCSRNTESRAGRHIKRAAINELRY